MKQVYTKLRSLCEQWDKQVSDFHQRHLSPLVHELFIERQYTSAPYFGVFDKFENNVRAGLEREIHSTMIDSCCNVLQRQCLERKLRSDLYENELVKGALAQCKHMRKQAWQLYGATGRENSEMLAAVESIVQQVNRVASMFRSDLAMRCVMTRELERRIKREAGDDSSTEQEITEELIREKREALVVIETAWALSPYLRRAETHLERIKIELKKLRT